MNSAPIAYLVLMTDLGPHNPPGYAASAVSIPKLGHCFQLTPGKNILGREAAPDVAIVVPAIAISRRHALIESMATGSWEIEDLQSRNGTKLNDQLLQPRSLAPLNEGDRIDLGPARLLFTFQPDPIDPRIVAERTVAEPTEEELEKWLRGPYLNGDH